MGGNIAKNLEGQGILDYAAKLVSGITEACMQIVDILSKLGEQLDTFGTEVTPMITAAASTIATLLVVIELCTHAMGFHFDDINDAVRFVFKVIVYKIIVENSGKIVDLVYGMFINDKAWESMKNGLGTVDNKFDAAGAAMTSAFTTIDDTALLGINKFLSAIVFLVVTVGVVIILIKIMAAMAGLLFELAINITIAPVPIATLVNAQTRQIGIGFIKGFAGNCLTLSMYSICFAIYGNLVGSLASVFSGTALPTTDVGNAWCVLVALIVGLLLLSTAINNVGTMMSKVLS